MAEIAAYAPPMSTLEQIEAAAVRLPEAQKEELLVFLAKILRSSRGTPLPSPRIFTKEEIAGWITEDEADMRQIRSEL